MRGHTGAHAGLPAPRLSAAWAPSLFYPCPFLSNAKVVFERTAQVDQVRPELAVAAVIKPAVERIEERRLFGAVERDCCHSCAERTGDWT